MRNNKTGHFDNAFRSLYVLLDQLLRQDAHRAELDFLSQSTFHPPHTPEAHRSPYPPPPLTTPASATSDTTQQRGGRFRTSVRLGGRKLYRKVNQTPSKSKKNVETPDNKPQSPLLSPMPSMAQANTEEDLKIQVSILYFYDKSDSQSRSNRGCNSPNVIQC